MAEKDDTLENLVRTALANAAENEYTFEGMTNAQIADDMCEFDSELAKYPSEQIERVLAGIRQ